MWTSLCATSRSIVSCTPFVAVACILTVAASAAVPPTRCPDGAVSVVPGASIQAAVARAGVGATVCVKAGIHRMQSVAPLAGQTIVGEAGAVLNGSRILTRFASEGPLWAAEAHVPRRVARGVCRQGYEACGLALGVFIDDQPLRQVNNISLLGAGRFFVDFANGRVLLADNPDGKTVEVSAARHAFRSDAPNVSIRNLIIEKYDSPAQEGAVDSGSASGWRIEDCEVRLNTGTGIAVASGGIIRNNRIHHNGQLGATAGGTGILIEQNTIWANNIYGFDPTWEVGGVKATGSQKIVFRRNHVHHNAGPGLWCDIDCADVIYEDNLVEYNEDAGIFHEISYAATIRNNVVRFNGRGHAKWVWGADIQIAASEAVEVYGNCVTVRLGGVGIVLVDQNRPIHKGGLYKTQKNAVFDNYLTFTGPGSSGGISDAPPGADNFAVIETGNNRFDRNTYWAPVGGPLVFLWGHQQTDFAGFRRLGQENGGVFDISARPSACGEGWKRDTSERSSLP